MLSKEEQLKILDELVDQYNTHKNLMKDSDWFKEDVYFLNEAIDNYSKAKQLIIEDNWIEAGNLVKKANESILIYSKKIDETMTSIAYVLRNRSNLN